MGENKLLDGVVGGVSVVVVAVVVVCGGRNWLDG